MSLAIALEYAYVLTKNARLHRKHAASPELTSVQAKYAVRFLKPGFGDVGYVAHPSFVEANELNDIEGPLSISAAGGYPLSHSSPKPLQYLI